MGKNLLAVIITGNDMSLKLDFHAVTVKVVT